MSKTAAKFILVRLGMVLFGLAVGLLIVELTLRLVPPPLTLEYLRGLHEVRRDRPWLFGLRPGARGRLCCSAVEYVINADGFRGRRYPRPKVPGTFRIVVLGDSIAFGYGVAEENTFPSVLERCLDSAARPVEVVNLGVSGYNPYNEAALFADIGVGYEPDLVLVQFCVNDLNDPTIHFDAVTVSHIGLIPDAAFPDPRSGRGGELPRLALRACRRLRSCIFLQDALPQLRVPDAPARDAAFGTHDDPSEREIAWLRGHYGAIAERAADIGAAFAVAIFPHRDQLKDAARDMLQARLAAMGREAAWPVIDLLPAFRDAVGHGREPLFLDPWHLTPTGHHLAAEELARQLARLGLLPAGFTGCARKVPMPPPSAGAGCAR